MNLKRIYDFVEEMKATSSSNDKKAILTKYKNDEYLKKVLLYTYHPFKQYYVTPKNLEKRSDLSKEGYSDLFLLLEALDSRTISGHAALACVNGFIAIEPEYKDIVYQILDRNLKTRATATIINEIIPGLIPVFEVQLAEKYEEGKIRKKKLVTDFEADVWYGSYKLDGIRCITIVDDNGIPKSFTRNGNEIKTVSKVHDYIKTLGLRSVVLDGELCISTPDGRDDFAGIQQEWNTKDHTMQNPKYYLFDYIPYDVFMGEAVGELFDKRMEALYKNVRTSPVLEILPQKRLFSMQHMKDLTGEAIESGREGLIIKKNTVYQGKRTYDLQKVKIMVDAEYRVIGTENDINRIIENGKEVDEKMMARVWIEHKGNRVDVGSGFSHAERRLYYQDPSLIIGKIITVRYQEETVDKHGKPSIRFGVFKTLHGDERLA